MDTVSRSDIEGWAESDPYYAGRAPYLVAAAEIVSRLPGNTALEIGPHHQCLVPGGDTMDKNPRLDGVTYHHDCAALPWPMPEETRYDIIIGLQVWEHIREGHAAASREAFHRGRYVLLSFPYRWPVTGLGGWHASHEGITRDVIARWTCNRDPILTLRVASVRAKRRDRILYLFKGGAT